MGKAKQAKNQSLDAFAFMRNVNPELKGEVYLTHKKGYYKQFCDLYFVDKSKWIEELKKQQEKERQEFEALLQKD